SSIWRRAARVATGTDRAPGDERVFSSPVVVGLAGAIALLVVLSVLLWRTISQRTADNQFQVALDTFNEGDYLNAINRFDKFLGSYPRDHRIGRASALRALSDVRQFTAGGAPAWSEGLEAARAMVRDFGDQETFADLKANLAEDVLKIAEGLSDRAKAAA